jgi:hypothetical protein
MLWRQLALRDSSALVLEMTRPISLEMYSKGASLLWSARWAQLRTHQQAASLLYIAGRDVHGFWASHSDMENSFANAKHGITRLQLASQDLTFIRSCTDYCRLKSCRCGSAGDRGRGARD